jgi:hypothetical protein
MALVTTEEFQREGRAVDGDMTALDEAVDRTQGQKQQLGEAKVPFPEGPWWQRWKGFRGAWSQYFEEQVKPTPFLPLHDDGDIQQWQTDLRQWTDDFAKGQKQNQAVPQLAGPLGSGPGTSSAATIGKALAVVAFLGAAGYALSNAAALKRAFA